MNNGKANQRPKDCKDQEGEVVFSKPMFSITKPTCQLPGDSFITMQLELVTRCSHKSPNHNFIFPNSILVLWTDKIRSFYPLCLMGNKLSSYKHLTCFTNINISIS